MNPEQNLLSLLRDLVTMSEMTGRKSGPDGIPYSAVEMFESHRNAAIGKAEALIEHLREGPLPRVVAMGPSTPTAFVVMV